MKNKLGIQCQEKDEEVYRYNRELEPIVVKSINILDPGHYARLAAENPGVQLVYRQVPNGPWDNEGDGRRWAEHLYNLVGHIPEITLVEGHNEWVHSPPHNTSEDFEKADRFMVELIGRVHGLWGGRVHVVVLNASCGHFNEDIVDFFPRTLAKLQECDKCLLGMHEYDHPDADMLGDGGHHLCGKFLRNLAGLRAAGYDGVRIAITECGVDSGVGAPAGSGHVGFKYWGEDAATRYLNERNLGWYLPLLQGTNNVAWATIFGCGMGGDWGTFDIKDTPVIEGIGRIFSDWSPPEPPNGGDNVIPDRVKIYDFDHGPGADDPTVSKEWLESIFGPCINVHPVSEVHQLQPGDLYYQLQWINCKPATTSCIIEVEDVDGNPDVGKTVIFGWPTADPHGLADQGWNWTINGAVGLTEAPDAHVGPNMTQDSYYSPDQGECGAHFIWIHDHPSVMVDGVGMLPFHDLVPGANHLHTEYGFKLARWGEEEPEPPEPPENGVLDKILEAVLRLDENVAGILSHLLKTPPEPPVDQPFVGEYFNNMDLGGSPVFNRADLAIDFEWGSGSPDPRINPDHFSVRWTGKRTFEARAYVFHAIVDDGIRLIVDGGVILESWRDQPPTHYQAAKTMTAGQHDIEVQYYERAGGSSCKVWWE